MLLHGCNQTAEDFAAATRFTAIADRHGFVVVAPSQSRTHQPGGCWRWYEAAHQVRGAGEPAILAGITARMLSEPSRWRIDPTRVYVAGISAGAAMALILGVTYPETFAAVGAHSGPAYRSATSGGAALSAMRGRGVPPPADPGSGMPPLIVFQGVADRVVDVRSGDQVTEQWLAREIASRTGPRDPQRITRTRTVAHRGTDGRRATVTRWYTARGRTQLEYWRVDGLGHAWSGGRRDGSYSDHRGPRASTLMWRFFAAHSR
jgi:poly(hydroxyalkanoate) depolymerase family esterase